MSLSKYLTSFYWKKRGNKPFDVQSASICSSAKMLEVLYYLLFIFESGQMTYLISNDKLALHNLFAISEVLQVTLYYAAFFGFMPR